MTMKFATIAIQDFASITLIGRVEHGAGCEALDLKSLDLRSISAERSASPANRENETAWYPAKRPGISSFS
jgi:hypothetical protein